MSGCVRAWALTKGKCWANDWIRSEREIGAAGTGCGERGRRALAFRAGVSDDAFKLRGRTSALNSRHEGGKGVVLDDGLGREML